MAFLLYTRRGCHLCEAAEDMLGPLVPAGSLRLIDVDEDAGGRRLYGDRVPVLLRDGVVVAEGRFDEAALIRLLAARSPGA